MGGIPFGPWWDREGFEMQLFENYLAADRRDWMRLPNPSHSYRSERSTVNLYAVIASRPFRLSSDVKCFSFYKIGITSHDDILQRDPFHYKKVLWSLRVPTVLAKVMEDMLLFYVSLMAERKPFDARNALWVEDSLALEPFRGRSEVIWCESQKRFTDSLALAADFVKGCTSLDCLGDWREAIDRECWRATEIVRKMEASLEAIPDRCPPLASLREPLLGLAHPLLERAPAFAAAAG